jgi:GT2 family glycosyltransferase
MTAPGPRVSVVIPNWNGRRWLPECLRSLAAQTDPADEVIVVDNGSDDGSLEYLRDEHPRVTMLAQRRNTGFAYAANRGIEAASGELVALINTDVVLSPDWLQRMAAALSARPAAASAACKMLSLSEPGVLYDAGDILRRDGACEQRGRFTPDDGAYDEPGEVFGACAGAALYRRDAVLRVGGFDERYFAYLEDVDLALRLRLTGWTCAYEPAVCWHAGEGSSAQLRGGHLPLVTRNTVLLVAKTFPLRWLGMVAYRQLGWAYHASRERRLGSHLRALAAAVPLLGDALAERRRLSSDAVVPISVAIPARPIRAGRRRSASGRSDKLCEVGERDVDLA